MPGWAIRSAGATLVVAALTLACRNNQADCKYDSAERCLWEGGVAPPVVPPSNTDEGDGDSEFDDEAIANEATKFEATLSEMVAIIGAGIEWAYVDESARALCTDPPHAPEPSPSLPTPSPEAWTCTVAELEISQQVFELEASDGVLSLSAVDIGEAESVTLFEFAQRRFDGWCADQTFKPFEGDALALYYRCSLPEGPYLVIARFPRDLEAGRWQVSIAIVDAG